jgi:hypothetical protein
MDLNVGLKSLIEVAAKVEYTFALLAVLDVAADIAPTLAQPVNALSTPAPKTTDPACNSTRRFGSLTA